MADGAKKNRIAEYFREVRAEIRKVTWPARNEVLRMSAIVMIVLLASSAFMAIVDYGFAWLMGLIVKLGTGL
jgi:preprotein translocase subunit SecE